MPTTILVVDVDHASSLDRLVGRSLALRELRETIQHLARDPQVPVLFAGETGTGRALAAKVLHRLSDRAARAFAVVACAAAGAALLDESLIESAGGGTLFLSGAHLASASLKETLRRLIDNRSIAAAGESNPPDVRLLASCDSRVDAANQSGTLANELCERLNARIVRVPPLRARAEDIEPLVHHYLTVFNRELGRRVERVSQDAVASLEAYTWPGNIRELRMVVERAVLAADGDRLEAADFALPTISRRSSVEMDLPPSGVNLERLERNLVIQALQRTGGNQTRAATLLGLNRDQVRYRIEKFGLTRN